MSKYLKTEDVNQTVYNCKITIFYLQVGKY